MNRVRVRACNGDDRCPLDERNFADARIFSSLTNIDNDVSSQLLPYPNIELFLESSSLTIQVSDFVKIFF